jgi:hypothetical protein
VKSPACDDPRGPVFVVQRVYALWGRNKKILLFLMSTFTVVYLSAFLSDAFRESITRHCYYGPKTTTNTRNNEPVVIDLLREYKLMRRNCRN